MVLGVQCPTLYFGTTYLSLTRISSRDENTRTWRDLLSVYLRLSIDIHWTGSSSGLMNIYGQEWVSKQITSAHVRFGYSHLVMIEFLYIPLLSQLNALTLFDEDLVSCVKLRGDIKVPNGVVSCAINENKCCKKMNGSIYCTFDQTCNKNKIK